MIFVTDASGRLIHISRDWLKLTGQEVDGALGLGFFDRIHPDDRAIVRAARIRAAKTAAEYSLRYRLKKADGTYRWVGAGGMPSFGADGAFIGYLGSITELAEGATDTITAYANIERFAPPKPHPATQPSSDLDMIADYLILAHSLIEKSENSSALPDLRAALFQIGQMLAARTQARTRTLN